MAEKRNLTHWNTFAHKRIAELAERAQGVPALRKKAKTAAEWFIDVSLVGGPAMLRLNTEHRRKAALTDVLSFEANPLFRREGVLGIVVICLPVLKRQAREMGHSPERELDVLLVHGLLHLLGFDHEKGPRHAREMARWEEQLLERRKPVRTDRRQRSVQARGLVARSSG